MVDNTNPLSFIFNGSDPNVNSQLRQRIALAMLAKQKKYPKTFGEGLAAIGDAIGDIGMARRLEQQDLADQAKDRALAGDTAAPGAIRTSEDATTPPVAQVAYAPAAVPAEPTEPAAPTALAQLPTATETVPEDMTTTPAAAQPASTMFDAKPMLSTAIQTPPAGQFTPRDAIARTIATQRSRPQGFDVAPGAIRDQGDYNEIDASAGMKRVTPGYMQDAIARQTDDPDMRAYLGSLSAGEAKNAQDVSPTGAAGPFQFTRGTARQYGLKDPTNLDASASAALDFTQDNANTFRRINGREPTMADLALMHQQGGTTGSRMVAGTGNAPAANLAVNNVPPGAGPADAVARIKGYYGMPERTIEDTGRTTLVGPGPGPRDRIAAAMTPPPVMAFDGRPAPANVAPAMPLQAPPPQQIRAAPPQQQIVQAPVGAQPPAIPGYVPPGGGAEPPIPVRTPYGPIEQKAMQELNDARRTGNQYTIDRTSKILAQEAEKRQYLDARNLEVYKEKLKQRDEANKAREAAKGTQTSRLNEHEKAQAELVEKRNEAEIVRRSNMKPEELYKRLDADKQSVDQAIKAQSAQALARKAIKDGVITGYGANMKVATAKFADWAFKNGLKGDLAANTEIMKAGLDAGLSEAVKTVNGEGGTGVSNTDVRIAQGIQGSDPNLQMKTIQTIMDRAAEINFRKINRYEDYIDKTLGGLPVELRYRSTHGPTAPAAKIDMLTKNMAGPDADEHRRMFDSVYGPGAAELEIARVERLARRKARGG